MACAGTPFDGEYGNGVAWTVPRLFASSLSARLVDDGQSLLGRPSLDAAESVPEL